MSIYEIRESGVYTATKSEDEDNSFVVFISGGYPFLKIESIWSNMHQCVVNDGYFNKQKYDFMKLNF